MGVGVKDVKTNRELGMDSKSWAFALSGHKFHNTLCQEYATKVKSGEKIGVMLDATGSSTTLSFFVNDVQQGVAFTGLPAPASLAPVIGLGLQKLKPGTTVDVLGFKTGKHVTTFDNDGDYYVYDGEWVE